MPNETAPQVQFWNTNRFRTLTVLVIGMIIGDLTAWGAGVEIDWKVYAVKYGIAALEAVRSWLNIGTASDSVKPTV